MLNLHSCAVKFFEYSSGLLIAKSKLQLLLSVVNATICNWKNYLIPKTAISIPTVRNIFFQNSFQSLNIEVFRLHYQKIIDFHNN